MNGLGISGGGNVAQILLIPQRINEEHRVAHAAGAEALAHATRCGELLIGKKSNL